MCCSTPLCLLKLSRLQFIITQVRIKKEQIKQTDRRFVLVYMIKTRRSAPEVAHTNKTSSPRNLQPGLTRGAVLQSKMRTESFCLVFLTQSQKPHFHTPSKG